MIYSERLRHGVSQPFFSYVSENSNMHFAPRILQFCTIVLTARLTSIYARRVGLRQELCLKHCFLRLKKQCFACQEAVFHLAKGCDWQSILQYVPYRDTQQCYYMCFTPHPSDVKKRGCVRTIHFRHNLSMVIAISII